MSLLLGEFADFGARIHANLLGQLPFLSRARSSLSLKSAFEGRPAVVFGAGASLSPELCRLFAAKALRLAAGSAGARLLEAGERPDLIVGVDSDPEERSLPPPCTVPYAFQGRSSVRGLARSSGPLLWVPPSGIHPLETMLHSRMGLEEYAFDPGWCSVTSSVALAQLFGCAPIYLVGVEFGCGEGEIAKADWRRSAEWLEQLALLAPGLLVQSSSSKRVLYRIPQLDLKEVAASLPEEPFRLAKLAAMTPCLDATGARAFLAEVRVSGLALECALKRLLSETGCTHRGERLLLQYELEEEIFWQLVIAPALARFEHHFQEERALQRLLFAQRVVKESPLLRWDPDFPFLDGEISLCWPSGKVKRRSQFQMGKLLQGSRFFWEDGTSIAPPAQIPFEMKNEAAIFIATPASGHARELLAEKSPAAMMALWEGVQPSITTAALEEEERRALAKENLPEEAELLCLYGVGLGIWASHFLPSLTQGKRLLLLEEEPAHLERFLSRKEALALLGHPAVELALVPKSAQERRALWPSLLARFPTDRMAFLAHPDYRRRAASRMKSIELEWLREGALLAAQLTDLLQTGRLLGNILPNFRRLTQVFSGHALEGAFQGVPAIICGAGPTLAEVLPYLKQLQDRALVIAGGSAIPALTSEGIVPHLGLAWDPNFEEFERLALASPHEMPLLYGSRVHPGIFAAMPGPFGYLSSGTGGELESWLEERLGIASTPVGPEMGPDALSVTTLAAALAVRMGCSPILLVGVDLAYVGGKRYPEGLLPQLEVAEAVVASDRLLQRKNGLGEKVVTQVKWAMEAKSLAQLARLKPQAGLCRASPLGLPIARVPYRSIEQLLPRSLPMLNLRARLAECVRQGREELKQKDLERVLEEALAELTKSLDATAELCDLALSGSAGHLALAEHSLDDELAFRVLLQGPLAAIDQILVGETDETAYRRRRIAYLREIIRTVQAAPLSCRGAACCAASAR